MSGHNKWSSIKHKKGAADAKRGRIFSKIIKEITIAARMGGGDEDSNPRLRTAVLKAKAANMPKDNVERAVKKGVGDVDGAEYFELVYEGYAPGGIALLIEALTDNKNRTAADVRSTLTKGGGSLGAAGSVAYQFNRKGVIVYDAENISEDKVLEIALDAGAEDVVTEDGGIEVLCDPSEFEAVLNALEAADLAHEMAEIKMVPDTTVALDKEKARKVLALIDKLEDLDDVQSVSSNLEEPDDMDDEEDA